MQQKSIWDLFLETGYIEYYLIYRAIAGAGEDAAPEVS